MVIAGCDQSDRTRVCGTPDSKPPFFCVHALGGNVLEYYDLARHLGDDQPFYGLQSAGLDGRRPPHTRVEDMAAHYIKEMRELQPEGPYFIGGRSLGGMVAFEMAQQLKAQGQTIGLLALLDTYPSGYAKLFRNEATLRAASRAAKTNQSSRRKSAELSVNEGLSYLIKKARFAPRKMKSQVWRRVYQSYENLGRLETRPPCRAHAQRHQRIQFAGRARIHSARSTTARSHSSGPAPTCALQLIWLKAGARWPAAASKSTKSPAAIWTSSKNLTSANSQRS